MTITLSFPDELAQAVPNAEQAAREGVAVEGYRLGTLSLGQVARVIGKSVWEASEILASHGCHLDMTAEEIEDDVRRLREFLNRKNGGESGSDRP